MGLFTLCHIYISNSLPNWVKTLNADHCDTLVAAVIDGQKIPLYFIISKAAKKIRLVEKTVKSMTAELMVKWMEKVLLPKAHTSNISFLITFLQR